MEPSDIVFHILDETGDETLCGLLSITGYFSFPLRSVFRHVKNTEGIEEHLCRECYKHPEVSLQRLREQK